MSWAEVKKINSNMNVPINQQIRNKDLYEAWLFTETKTFSPPVNGLYKVICIGAGSGGSSSLNGKWGGNAGGVVISVLELNSSQSYNITVSNNASFSNLLTATAGSGTVSGSGGGGSGGTVYEGGIRNGSNGGSVGVFIPGAMEYPLNADNVGGIGLYGGSKSAMVVHNISSSNEWQGTTTICSSGGGYGAGGSGGSYFNKGSAKYYTAPGGAAAVIVILIEEGGEL